MILFIFVIFLDAVMVIDYVVVFEIVFAIIVMYILLRYSLIVRRLINEYRNANDLVKSVVDSIDRKIDWYNEKILDLLYRVDVMEVKYSVSKKNVIPDNIDNVASDVIGRPVSKHHHDITEFEFDMLKLLQTGPKSSIEVQKSLGRSREHVARVMKIMFDCGYINRDENKKPFLYTITDLGKRLLL